MAYNFTQVKQIGDFEVHIDPDSRYGYFENIEVGGEGGLWFDVEDGTGPKLELIDFDGYFALPAPVAEAVRSFGHIVGDDFL